MPRAIIVGCNGQDGTLLYKLLEEQGYALLGVDKNTIWTTGSSIFSQALDICKTDQVYDVVREVHPDEIYYLAGFHHSSQDAPLDPVALLAQSFQVNAHSLVNFLEGIRRFSPRTRLFYAASSHVFGEPSTEMQNEDTPLNPHTTYGITKAAGLFFCRAYRRDHQIFASAGILYNHESALRNEKFVSQKIVRGAVRIKGGAQDRLVLGNLNAETDWGYAPDYVEAMQRILALPEADDFIVATGVKHTVEEFAAVAFQSLGLDWRQWVEEDPGVITRKTIPLVGNPARLMTRTQWKPSVSFQQMIELLVTQAAASPQPQ